VPSGIQSGRPGVATPAPRGAAGNAAAVARSPERFVTAVLNRPPSTSSLSQPPRRSAAARVGLTSEDRSGSRSPVQRQLLITRPASITGPARPAPAPFCRSTPSVHRSVASGDVKKDGHTSPAYLSHIRYSPAATCREILDDTHVTLTHHTVSAARTITRNAPVAETADRTALSRIADYTWKFLGWGV